jgi:hypothetical protein
MISSSEATTEATAESGLSKAHRLSPEGLQTIIDNLNVALVA